eukprot:Selendium_serpulae@DN9950_c0_g1_i1.p1
MNHGINCHKGGLIDRRYNEIRNALAAACSKAFGGQPIIEALLDTAADGDDTEMRLDILVRGGIKEQTLTLIDVACVNANAASYSTKSTKTVLEASEAYKRNKYAKKCLDKRAKLVPFIT